MTRILRLREEADDDLSAIYEYLLQQAGERTLAKFENKLDAIFERILEMPFMYGKVWRTVRAVKVRGYKYVLYYIVRSRIIDVVGVIHGSRHLSAWKSRV